MAHLGDFDASAVIYGKFTTYRPSTGAPFTLGGTPALSVYKDNSTTQSTTGVTLTVDFDSVTGLHHFAIDTSADGTFYAAGSFFDIVITTGTVDSVSVVGSVVASFTIRKNSALKPTTAGRTLDVSTGGEAGLDWANIGSPTTTVNLSGTTVKTATDVETDTADIQSRLPAALVSGRIDASVGAVATGAITSGAFAAGAIDAAAIATDAITSAELAATATAEIATAVRTELATELARIDVATSTRLASASYTAPLDAAGTRAAVGLASANLDTQIATLATAANLATVAGYIDTEVAAIKAKTDNLPASPAATGDIPTAAAVADAVWDEAIAGHAGAGSTGEALAAAGAAGDPWITALPGSYSAGQAGHIVGTYLDAAISAVPTATENADALLNRDMSAVSDTNSRSPLNALRFLRNLWSLVGTTLTVKKEDDSTTAWTATVTTNAAADPITGSDPS